LTKPRLKIAGTIALLLVVLIAVILTAVYVAGFFWSSLGPEPTAIATPTYAPSQIAPPTETPTTTNTTTPTSRPSDTPTPNRTRTPTPTLTQTPTPTPAPSATPTITPAPHTPTPLAIYPAPTLLAPSAGAKLFGRQRFTWQGDGPALEPNRAFDLRIWSQQEQQAGRPKRGAVPPTRDTEAEVTLQFVPAIKDYGVGDYYWTVVVVEIVSGGSPRVVGTWGEARKFSYGTGTPTSPGSPSPGPTAPTSPEPPNQAPVARFSYECSGLKCDFDGGGSFDPDGSIVSHSWSFGDGEGGSGTTASHKFKNAGTYTVVLTVTDNRGATGSQPKNVRVP
jgi:hypothetical protein